MSAIRPATDRQVELMRMFWEETPTTPAIRELNASLLRGDFLSLLARVDAISAENERMLKALEWALDHATDSDHPHYPARGESWPWAYPYLVCGTPFGGGVGEAGFSSVFEAVEAAMVETRS